jgi:hypothetical protein
MQGQVQVSWPPALYLKKVGFTMFNIDEFKDMVAEKPLKPDGYGMKYTNHGPLDKCQAPAFVRASHSVVPC